ncbi:MAG: glycerol kinase GlpK [Gammaproteobacteria bacterium]|nr:glycerol kinase GlpK [Gammaproteobacteria bacterium]NIR84954.1 glycerol kinase GlpK [Gammaproteobacteria bacterium]NIR91803.1 glycerol kinase GlpK [Gammaproteobacteria bacterium]NIU06001.1 glycerol kinase GlpK [Gammaproteobacteria bacterium]NIV53048.1 glycerol kinase GlpK [Gammaproteobacteria bacterium]
MTAKGCILAIDQGTTSTRAIVFDSMCHPVALAQREFPQIYPREGWVEHDPEEIWRGTVDVARAALAEAEAGGHRVVGLGLTNQRETTVIWDRRTGKPIHNAIVWQDRRTAGLCRRLIADGHEALIRQRTGLVIDPYFSATKIVWLLDNVPDSRRAAEAGDLAFGTIDSFLLWRLTDGALHATDATNASRTMLFNIHELAWDREVLALLDIPPALLPEIRDNTGNFGDTARAHLGVSLPIAGMAGDQQAATIGQACFDRGMVKSTCGTGCFVLLNTGGAPVASDNRLLTTLTYRIDGQATYALEGSIFVAGAALQWVRDQLHLIGSAAESEALAAGLEHNGGVYMVPAFTGLGAPYWDPDARGAIVGLTRNSGAAEVVRAALEAVCYQTCDLVTAMEDDSGAPLVSLRVDGGMVVNNWLLQFLANVLNVPVERPRVTETTALGAAFLAGLQVGVFSSFDDIRRRWRRDAMFKPDLVADERERLLEGWHTAVARVRGTGR